MYSPSHFQNKDLQTIVEFIKEFSFGSLITSDTKFPIASLIPMELLELENEMFLLGHISASNPQAKTFVLENCAALAIFTAGHSYVSSSWYEKENVSTWNYRSVQVKGFITPLLGDDLRSHLIRMQATYEKDQKNPRTVETMSDGYFEKQVKGVSGFMMKIESLEGSWKLSQNRNEKDFNTIINELDKLDDANSNEIADEMRKLCKKP